MISSKYIQRLKNFSLFKDIAHNEEQLNIIASIMERRAYKKGDYIFKEGGEGHELYLLIKGSVRVLKNTKQQEEYTIVDLNAESHVFFGEIALMDRDKRSASIQVLEDCECLVIDRDKFEAMGDTHPEIGLLITRVIIKDICGRLRNVNDDVILLFDALVGEIETTQL